MGESWENEVVRKKDIVDWLQKAASAYRDLQYHYRYLIDYGKEIAILDAAADYVRCMNPDNTEKAEE